MRQKNFNTLKDNLDTYDVSEKDWESLRLFANKGYAIVLITPEELNGVSPEKVEDRLIELSWDIINDLKD